MPFYIVKYSTRGYRVEDEKGKAYSNKNLTLKNARQQQKALYANLPERDLRGKGIGDWLKETYKVVKKKVGDTVASLKAKKELNPVGAIIGFNYCGPSTQLKGQMPVNKTDEHCMMHDYEYEALKNARLKGQLSDADYRKQVREADERLVKGAEAVKENTLLGKVGNWGTRNFIKLKMKAEDAGLLHPDRFVLGGAVAPLSRTAPTATIDQMKGSVYGVIYTKYTDAKAELPQIFKLIGGLLSDYATNEGDPQPYLDRFGAILEKHKYTGNEDTVKFLGNGRKRPLKGRGLGALNELQDVVDTVDEVTSTITAIVGKTNATLQQQFRDVANNYLLGDVPIIGDFTRGIASIGASIASWFSESDEERREKYLQEQRTRIEGQLENALRDADARFETIEQAVRDKEKFPTMTDDEIRQRYNENWASSLPARETAVRRSAMSRAMRGRGVSNAFKTQLESIGYSPQKYLSDARRVAKRMNYNPSDLQFSDNDTHKLMITDPKGTVRRFGRVGYGDFLLWKHQEKAGRVEKGYANKKRMVFRISHIALGKKHNITDEYAPNTLAINILW